MSIKIEIGGKNCEPTPWDANLDYSMRYSGTRITCDLVNVSPDDNLRDVLMQFGNAICKLAEGEEPIPSQIIVDDEVTFHTTGAQLNAKYGDMVLGTVVHNDDNVKFTKISPTKWEFEIIELR